MPNQRRRRTRPLRGLGFGQSGTLEIIPNSPAGVLNCSFSMRWLTIRALQQQRENP